MIIAVFWQTATMQESAGDLTKGWNLSKCRVLISKAGLEPLDLRLQADNYCAVKIIHKKCAYQDSFRRNLEKCLAHRTHNVPNILQSSESSGSLVRACIQFHRRPSEVFHLRSWHSQSQEFVNSTSKFQTEKKALLDSIPRDMTSVCHVNYIVEHAMLWHETLRWSTTRQTVKSC